MSLFPDNINRLLHVLFQPRSLRDRVRGDSERHECLEEIAASGDVRIVPVLLPMVAADDALSERAAGTIAHLMRGISPAQLASLDEQVRRESYDYAWRRLSPETVTRLSRTRAFDLVVIGLFCSHRNGFVRATALDCLAGLRDGREIPILTLRANDWVAPVAARATALLMERLRPDNRHTVLATLPFFVRLLGSRRRDHQELLQTLRSVLLSDGGDEALRWAGRFDTLVRRHLYDLLDNAGTDAEWRVVRAGLNDPDAVIRVRTLRRLASSESVDDPAAILEGFLSDDSVPAVRQTALSLLSVRAPDRMAAVVPSALLDRAARVRGLARVLVLEHGLAVVPRDIYIQLLTRAATSGLAAAIEGVGETGTRADLALIAPFLHDSSARVRRAALRAAIVLDVDVAIPNASAALVDEVRSVRTMAVRILRLHASRVDFEMVNRRLQTVTDPAARRTLLPLLGAAPKWEAAVYLLQALSDPREDVRTVASSLLDSWLANFNRNQVPPSPVQLLQIHRLLAIVGGELSTEAAKLLRLSIGRL